MNDTTVRLQPGDRVKFTDERWRYTVQAITSDRRYAICTRPFPLRNTVSYTIVDFDEQVRGSDDRLFSVGYEDEDDIERNRDRLERREMGVSHRNRVALAIERIESAHVGHWHTTWSAR